MLHRLLILVLLIMSNSSAHAENQPKIFLPIESMMTAAELERSGIGQLTEKELKVLNQWLQLQNSTGLTNELAVRGRVVQDQDKSAELPGIGKRILASLKRETPSENTKIIYLDRRSADVISTRIAGAFAGWRGKTLFELDNGQIWRQRYSGYWKVKLDNPEVSIQKNGSGAYEMELVSSGKKIGVKRVR